MNSANATIACRVSTAGATTRVINEAHTTIDRMPTPEIGLFDAPMRPAIYPQMPAMTNPIINTNGTATSVSLSALGASTVELAKVYARYAEMTRHAAVRT